MVVGVWHSSPFGAFADAMVQTADDRRLLLAPTAEVAEFVSATYAFDEVRVGAIAAELSGHRLTVTGADLDVTAELGGPARFDRLLRLVPGPLASAPWWLRVINPVAGLLVPGSTPPGRRGADAASITGCAGRGGSAHCPGGSTGSGWAGWPTWSRRWPSASRRPPPTRNW